MKEGEREKTVGKFEKQGGREREKMIKREVGKIRMRKLRTVEERDKDEERR